MLLYFTPESLFVADYVYSNFKSSKILIVIFLTINRLLIVNFRSPIENVYKLLFRSVTQMIFCPTRNKSEPKAGLAMGSNKNRARRTARSLNVLR